MFRQPPPNIFRLPPPLPPHVYKTYTLAYPTVSHSRAATCDEVDCLNLRNGWVTRVDETTDFGQRQAHYIRTYAGRVYTESREETRTLFVFAPGERCFATHRVWLERPGVHVVRGGDWRGNPRGERRVHADAAHWQEDFSEHMDRLSAAQR